MGLLVMQQLFWAWDNLLSSIVSTASDMSQKMSLNNCCHFQKFKEGCTFSTNRPHKLLMVAEAFSAMVTCCYALIACILMMAPRTLQMRACCGSFLFFF